MYLDNAATTPLTSDAKKYIIELLDQYYNPSSLYQNGSNVRQIINKSRENVAKFINAKPDNIIFTSSGSASNSLAIQGFLRRNNYTMLYSPIAHKSIIKCAESVRKAYPLKVDHYGNIDFYDLREWLDSHSDKFFVVLDYANSEIGTIQEVKRLIELVHFYNGVIYLDCTGSISQIQVDVKQLNVDMLGFSAHKLGALKGCGVFYKKENIDLEPLVYGTQEGGYFSGTEHVLGIASLGKAIENYDYSSISSENRDYVYKRLIETVPDCCLVGAPFANRLPHNLYMCFKGVQGESLMTLLDIHGIQVSTGSACSSGNPQPSSTLLAIGMGKDDIHSCIRLSFSGREHKDELNIVCKTIKDCVKTLREFNGMER